MTERLVSVVIPSYNYAGFLPPAVASVAAQTYPAVELVLVDDCSTDGSREVIAALSEQYRAAFAGGIKTLSNDVNLGAHAAINRGVCAAGGELVTVLNADDLYETDRLAVMTAAMKKRSARFAFSAVRCIGADGMPLDTEEARGFTGVQQKINGKRLIALSAVAENVAISTGNMLFEKKLFESLGGFKNYRYVHDYDFLLRACLATEPVFVRETAYLYRLHGGNSFLQLKKEGLVENRLVWLDFYGAVKRGRVENPEILRNPEYRREFYAAVRREGNKKRMLWALAGNPAVRACAAAVKKKHRLD